MKKSDTTKSKKQHSLSFYLRPEGPEWSPYANVRQFVNFINPVEGVGVIDAKNSEIFVRNLPFYPAGQLLLLNAQTDQGETSLYYLVLKNDIIGLNGNSDHIYEFNDLVGIKLTESNILEYLKFFGTFIRYAEEGLSFYLIESANSEFIKDWSEYDKQRALKNFKPPVISKEKVFGNFIIHAHMMYGYDLYNAELLIDPEGRCTMTKDEKLSTL